MAIKITSTKQISLENGLNFLGYGPPGAGKTRAIKTFPDLEKTLIINAENGIFTLSDVDIPTVTIKSMSNFQEILEGLQNPDSELFGFKYIAFDSITHIANHILEHSMATMKDGRQAYLETKNKFMKIFESFVNLEGISCYFIAGMERMEDSDGGTKYGPSMPGQKLANEVAAKVDFVFAFRTTKDAEGNIIRYIQTESDSLRICKSRSNKLNPAEPVDFSNIFKKVLGNDQIENEQAQEQKQENETEELTKQQTENKEVPMT